MSYRNLTINSLNSRLKDIWEDARLGRCIAQAAVGFGALSPLMALANPAGGQVVGGTASISAPNANKMVIDQTSQNAIINWQQFSVGAHQYVQFIQPNSSAVVLNRVISNDPSRIFGNISANGQVFLVNPNGIYFAPGSSLDASGMLISTLDIKNNDFMQGNYVFAKDTNAPDGATINQGSMTTTANGYVVLAGDYVENDGRIQAQTGRVYLAAGASATLTFDSHQLISYTVDSATLARLAGAVNAGDIVATGGAVFMTGDVANALTATAVNNQGFIAAKSIQDHNGTIVLEATGGDLINSGRLVADAAASAPDADGGTIILRGNEHTQLTDTSRIDAAGGGTGAGGFIELSGHTLGVRGAATAGKGGHLLLDPFAVNIVTGSGNGSTGGIASIGTQFIANALIAGNNVTILASHSIANLGHTARTITATTGLAANATLAFDIGYGTCANGACVGTPPTIDYQGGTIDLTGLTINIKGGFVAHAGSSSGHNGHVTLSDVTAKGIAITGEFITVGNLHATGPAASGNIVVHGSDSVAAFSGGNITVNGAVTADHGSVTFTAQGGGDSSGGNINVSGNIIAAGAVHVNATYIGTSPAGGGASIHLANVSGRTVSINDVSTHPQVIVGNVTATGIGVGDRVFLFESGGGSGSALIKTGNVTAAGNAQSGGVNISISRLGDADNIQLGAVSSPKILISLNGNGDITTSALTANAGAGMADIQISVRGNNDAILVNGDITATGTMPTTGGPGSLTGPFGMPAAAHVSLQADTSCSCAAAVKVMGNINVTANGHTFAASSHNEIGVGPHTLTVTGSGGVGDVFIVAQGNGAATVTGNINVIGPDAEVALRSKTISTGNISVTGQGHTISRALTVTSGASAGTYHSHNSVGNALVSLSGVNGSASYGGPAATIHAGAINVLGKGVAEVALLASNVTAGGVTVAATAAKGTVKASGGELDCRGFCSVVTSTEFFRGIANGALGSGSLSAGRADIDIAAGSGNGFGSGAPGVSIKTGALSATGAGQAFISLSAKSIQTQALTVVSTKGTEKGTGSSVSGANNSTGYVHTFNGSGGVADIKIRSGNSGSHSSGVLTQNGGPVTINGAITAKGPRATVDIKGKTITVGGTVTVAGSGGTLTSTTKVTGPNGGFSTSFSGPERPTSLNLQGAASGSVNVAGKIGVKGPGLVGLIVVGGGVTLHGLSGSASAVKTYVTKDTRISTTKTTNTVSSLAVFVDDVSVTGGALTFTSAADTGDVTLRSKGNVDMASRINVNGNLNVAAVGNIFGTSNGVVTRFNAVQNQVRVGSNSSGGGPSPGVLPTASFKANAMAFVAGKSISMSGTQLTIGNGSISSVHGDAELLLGLADAGIAPAASNPNGAFIAGGSVSLGGLKLTGSYLLLQGTAVSILGPVSVPAGTLVQVVPFDPAEPMDIENTLSSSAVLNLSATSSTFNLSNQGFISLFAGDTVAVGNDDETGNVTLGANGPINIGSTNLIIDTSGTITGLSTVTSTGLVNSLLAILGPPVPPPTAGEIDPSTGSTAPPNDYKKPGTGGDDPNAGGGGGTITQDTGTASVCH